MEKQFCLPLKSKCFLTVDGNQTIDDCGDFCYDILIKNAQQPLIENIKKSLTFKTEVWVWSDDKWTQTNVGALTNTQTTIFVPKVDFLSKNRFSFEDAKNILAFLRSPNGCPWDKSLTLEQIRTNIIEEAYELVDAIDSNNGEKIAEETGDLFMQSIFVNLMSIDKGYFGNTEVYDMLCKKLIFRHTHIFGTDKANDAKSALDVWESNKKKEKKFLTHTQNLQDVPKGMSALMRSQKIGKRAAKAGFDFATKEDVIKKILEEVKEVENATEQKDQNAQMEELGDLLFSVVNLARFLDVNAEVALNQAANKFISRFEYVEQQLALVGQKFEQADPKLTDKLWESAKKEVLCED